MPTNKQQWQEKIQMPKWINAANLLKARNYTSSWGRFLVD
jgi:hypothetical protein